MKERERTNTVVSIVGLGYVGLPLAVRAQERGFDVVGFDVDEKKNALINQGKSPIEDRYLEENLPKFPFRASSDPHTLATADIVLV